ncbi:MAG: YggS family pyridoxal phosphate-dependent enzyme [Bacteroidales bacterium]|nr:YggS family pyridoxal phosphate-dependent enzyme [Bacteroidales bacterium]MBQ2599449.1 YggS family pyridoxal phosphate-dependent enzyme [Bacteroidales bacterium]MBQ4013510.1 YggS family pyridoxal phosphate-dependent enzyme [Bacteroidales bacterium]
MSITSAIQQIKSELPSTVQLVAVSKFKPASDILEAYRAGQRAFGENRPQELAAKAAELPADIQWHFIGHLQTNKVKLVVPHATLIHSVDSERLLAEIDKVSRNLGKTSDILLEVHIAEETTKQGLSPEEAEALAGRMAAYPNVRLRGVMGMATFTDDMAQVRREFRTLKALSERLSGIPGCDQVSMGMSEDWPVAVEEGTTIVRIGTAIFGKRNQTR